MTDAYMAESHAYIPLFHSWASLTAQNTSGILTSPSILRNSKW